MIYPHPESRYRVDDGDRLASFRRRDIEQRSAHLKISRANLRLDPAARQGCLKPAVAIVFVLLAIFDFIASDPIWTWLVSIVHHCFRASK